MQHEKPTDTEVETTLAMITNTVDSYRSKVPATHFEKGWYQWDLTTQIIFYVLVIVCVFGNDMGDAVVGGVLASLIVYAIYGQFRGGTKLRIVTWRPGYAFWVGDNISDADLVYLGQNRFIKEWLINRLKNSTVPTYTQLNNATDSITNIISGHRKSAELKRIQRVISSN